MDILYVSQYFPPEMGAPSARVFELSREWVRLGHRVTVLTGFPNHPEGRVRDAYRKSMWRLTTRESVEGIEVVRTWLYPSANKGTVGRSVNYSSFCLSASLRGLVLDRPDVVIGSSPQPLVALAASVLARRFRSPFVFEVRDLWPESLPAVGQTREDSFMYRAVRRVADHLYRESALVAVASAGFVPIITQRFPQTRIALAQNGVDTEVFRPAADVSALKRELGLQDRFVVTYAGTIGMAHGLGAVLDAAARLKDDRPDMAFVFVGEGAERDRLEARARERRLGNVIFAGQVPREKVVSYIGASDVCLVHLRNQELFETVLPSKMFEFMACGKPMIVGVGGVTKHLVETSGAGITITPENVDELVAAIERLSVDGTLRQRMGQQGLAHVRGHFTRTQQAAVYLKAIGDVTAMSTVAQPAEATMKAGI